MACNDVRQARSNFINKAFLTRGSDQTGNTGENNQFLCQYTEYSYAQIMEESPGSQGPQGRSLLEIYSTTAGLPVELQSASTSTFNVRQTPFGFPPSQV